MSSISIENAQAHLPELIGQLQPGEAVVITRDEKPVAQLVAAGGAGQGTGRLGSRLNQVDHRTMVAMATVAAKFAASLS